MLCMGPGRADPESKLALKNYTKRRQQPKGLTHVRADPPKCCSCHAPHTEDGRSCKKGGPPALFGWCPLTTFAKTSRPARVAGRHGARSLQRLLWCPTDAHEPQAVQRSIGGDSSVVASPHAKAPWCRRAIRTWWPCARAAPSHSESSTGAPRHAMFEARLPSRCRHLAHLRKQPTWNHACVARAARRASAAAARRALTTAALRSRTASHAATVVRRLTFVTIPEREAAATTRYAVAAFL